jgi:hypothetical protein
MLRTLLAFSTLAMLAACVSFNSSAPAEAPDYIAFCQGKEEQCKQVCEATGVQNFSCKAAPREGLEYKCECKKPLSRI